MKAWKQEIVEDILKKTRFNDTVSLFEVCTARGYKHVGVEDSRDIVRAVLRERPDFAIIRLAQHDGQTSSTASLFTAGTFVRQWGFVKR